MIAFFSRAVLSTGSIISESRPGIDERKLHCEPEESHVHIHFGQRKAVICMPLLEGSRG